MLILAAFLLNYTPPAPPYFGSGNGLGIENRIFSVDFFPEFSQWGTKLGFKFQCNPDKLVPDFFCFETGIEVFDPSSKVFGDGIRNQVVSFARIGYDNRFLFPYRRWKGLELRMMIGLQHLIRTMKIDGLENGARALDYGFRIVRYFSRHAIEATVFVDDPLQGHYRKTKVSTEIIGRRKFYESRGLYDVGRGFRLESAIHLAHETQYGSVSIVTIDVSFQKLTRPLDISFIPRIGYQFNTGNGLKSGPMLSVGLWIKKY